ncbi:hypothetical protein F0L17_14400 [Streptomyces sp. TRM43335]|uniref:Uncharacterized protein n=1 Tax=Streptomyces taklimakanensis TaxID=2569853 RepID=A0A6G2BDE9_9ACTN|nr:hypothetical protein [Streptomyces taklimakanensis]MTE20278.1 hypothetical protein [Streptomyces taklimakanensis]
MTGTAASLRITRHGFAVLPANVSLQATGSGAWTNTGLQATLPEAGVYHLDASVRGLLNGASNVNAYVLARLLDATTGLLVPDSEVLVHQIAIAHGAGDTSVAVGGNRSASISVRYAVPAPRTVRLQVARVTATGATTNAAVYSDGNGRTTLRYLRVA